MGGTATEDTSVTPTGKWPSLKALPWFVVLIPAAYVLNLWVETGVSSLAVVRSLLIVTTVAALLTTVIAIATRRPHLAGIVVLVGFGLLASRGPVYAAAIVLIAVLGGLALYLWTRARRERLTWRRAGDALNVVAVLILLVVVGSGLFTGTVASIPDDLDQGTSEVWPAAEEGTTDHGMPDIYVVLLDGYPRTDWLSRLFGGDNGAFLEALTERGFDIAERSSSNYMFTELTLTSMLNMAAMEDIEGIGEVIRGEVNDHTRLRKVLNENRLFGFLRERGYRIVTSSPGYEHVSMRLADTYLDGGQLNDFEYHLVRYTVFQWLVNRVAPDFFGDQQRERIDSEFAAIADVIAQPSDRPVFAFFHIPAPHPPIVFDADGGRAPRPPSGDVFQQAHSLEDLDADAYVNQIAYLNRAALDALDAGLEARDAGDPPVVIVMSDHGAAPRPEVFEGEGGEEHHANLFAAMTPGKTGLYAEDVSPVNVFRILLDAYFDAGMDPLPDRVYSWDSTTGTDAP